LRVLVGVVVLLALAAFLRAPAAAAGTLADGSEIDLVARGAGTVITATPGTVPGTAVPTLGDCTSVPQSGSPGASCALVVAAGSKVTATAVPDPGFQFRFWTRPDCPSTPVCTITAATANEPLGAVFSGIRLAVTPQSPDQASGFARSTPPGISCPPTCRADFTAPDVALTADAVATASGVDDPFADWDPGTACAEGGASTTCTVHLAADSIVSYLYQEPPDENVGPVVTQFPLRLSLGGSGHGTVSVVDDQGKPISPSPCTSTCSILSLTQLVTVTESAAPGSQASWVFSHVDQPCATPACSIDLADGISGISACFNAARSGVFAKAAVVRLSTGAHRVTLRVAASATDATATLVLSRNGRQLVVKAQRLHAGTNSILLTAPASLAKGAATLAGTLRDAVACSTAATTQRLTLG
jgi:hypothetical protein